MPPITLGPFTVAPDGVLQPREAGLRPALRFAWRGRRCEAEFTGDSLRLTAIAARIPSTAEPGSDRTSAFTALAALPRSLPPGWRLSLLPDHRIRLETAATLNTPPTATALIASMIRFALVLDPYLDRLEAACGRSSGTVKTWPG